MRNFCRLFSLSLTHQYFSSGSWNAVAFSPTAASQRAANVCGLVLKSNGNTLNVLFDTGRLSAIRLLAEETDGELRLGLKAVVSDRTYLNYTLVGARAGDKLLCFDNRKSTSGEPDGASLSRDAIASIADLCAIDDLINAGLLSPAESRAPPDFLIDLRFKAENLCEPLPQPSSFKVGFATRTLLWNYYLLGSIKRDHVYIVDLDGQVEFEFLGGDCAVGGRPASVFRSKTSLPIQESSPLRFQLREHGNGSGAVLLKRLPVAATNFGMQTIDGEEKMVSNIFVNF